MFDTSFKSLDIIFLKKIHPDLAQPHLLSVLKAFEAV